MPRTTRRLKTTKSGRSRSTTSSQVDFPNRRPSQDERDQIAALLKLTPGQAERLWRAVDRMCRGFEAYRAAKPLPGAERAAMLQDLRNFSARLDRLADWTANASPHVVQVVQEVLGPVLAERLSEIGFWQPTGSYPVDRFSVHHLDQLECEHNPETNECAGVDRVSAGRFLRQVETYQVDRRLNAADTVTATVLRGLIHALNTPVREYLELASRHRGGRTGQPFRNAVIRQLARAYREITGKKPTSSPRGAFAHWCELILDSLGMSTEGLEAALLRQLSSPGA